MVELLADGVLALDARALSGAPDAVVQPGDDVSAAGFARPDSNHRVIAIAFPKFGDGRGYSSAAILRESGFAGDVRAVGDVTVDQLRYLERVGFSSVRPDRPIAPEAARQALERFAFVYQAAADGRAPAWRLRHG
jgi:uncharacterized protein (DUF934 family)